MTTLTPQELAVLRELATGATYEMTAHRLGVTRNTIGRHTMNAYHKLDVGGAIDAFRVLGWLRVPRSARG